MLTELMPRHFCVRQTHYKLKNPHHLLSQVLNRFTMVPKAHKISDQEYGN